MNARHLSVKATSPARKMRCVSGQMNAAVVMDTLELAVTLNALPSSGVLTARVNVIVTPMASAMT